MHADLLALPLAPETPEMTRDPGLHDAEAAFEEAVLKQWFANACRRVRRTLEDAGYVLDETSDS